MAATGSYIKAKNWIAPDFGRANVQESIGKLGRGKRVEIPARPLAPGGLEIERTLIAEVYDDFPQHHPRQLFVQKRWDHGFSD